MLTTGTQLAQGPRTVAAALRAMGRAHARRFERDHRVLSRGRRSGMQGPQILRGLSMARPPPGWAIRAAVDETLARRPGAHMAATGMYSCVRLGWECLSAQAGLVSRLRLDARRFAPASPPVRCGPKPKKGPVLARLATRLEEARTPGAETAVRWVRGETETLRPLGGEDLWHTLGGPPRPIRWV